MNHEKSKTPSKRRRSCYDRWRAQMIAASRAPRDNSAASVTAQLMALFAVMVGRMPLAPPTPAMYVAPPVSPAFARRKELAQGLGVPVRYVDIAMARGSVPYSVLFHHMREGGVQRRDAMFVLRKRAPEASMEWLDHVERTDRWSDLLICFVRSEYEEDTNIRILKSTLACLELRNPVPDVPGPAYAETALKPGASGEEPDPDHDPDGPKGHTP